LDAEESVVRLQEKEVRARQLVPADDHVQKCVISSSDFQSFEDSERIEHEP
jgi:hypothetical protein